MVRTHCFHCRSPGLVPRQGNTIPQAAEHRQKMKKSTILTSPTIKKKCLAQNSCSVSISWVRIYGTDWEIPVQSPRKYQPQPLEGNLSHTSQNETQIPLRWQAPLRIHQPFPCRETHSYSGNLAPRWTPWCFLWVTIFSSSCKISWQKSLKGFLLLTE